MMKKVRHFAGGILMFLGACGEWEWLPMSLVLVLMGILLLEDLFTKEEQNG